MSKEIESITSEELSNEDLAGIQGGEQRQHGNVAYYSGLPDTIELPDGRVLTIVPPGQEGP